MNKHDTIMGIQLVLVLVGEDQPDWDPQNVHYRYSLLVEGPNGKLSCFDFWGSRKDYEEKRPENVEPREVFLAVLDDAICYLNARDIDDFAAELGFTKPSEAIRAWEGCKSTAARLQSIGFDEDTIIAIANRLRDEV